MAKRINITLNEDNYSDLLIINLLGKDNCNTKTIKKLLLQMAMGTHISNDSVTTETQKRNVLVTNEVQEGNNNDTEKIQESNDSVPSKLQERVKEVPEKLPIENKAVIGRANFDNVIIPKDKKKNESKTVSSKETLKSIESFF